MVRYQLVYADMAGNPYYDQQLADDSGGTDEASPSGDITSAELAEYHSWIDWEITDPSSDLNVCIAYCGTHNIKLLVDVHFPPGGTTTDGVERIFQFNDCYQEYIADMTLLGQTFTSNTAVWGYDLCNEPSDGGNYNSNTGVFTADSACFTDWNQTALAAAQAIRQNDNTGGNDPAHSIVVEIAGEDFGGLTPLTGVAGVVYSFHTYGVHDFSYQDDDSAGTVVWPDPTPTTNVDGTGSLGYNFQRNDFTFFYTASLGHVQAARDFQLANHCQIFIGEFGAFRWSPGAPEFSNEIITYCETYGWDWTYTGFRDDVAGGWTGYDIDDGTEGGNNDAYQVPGGLPFVPKTDLKTLLTGWFLNNASPVANSNFTTNPPLAAGAAYYSSAVNASPWTLLGGAGIASNGAAFGNPDTANGQCALLQSGGPNPTLVSEPVQWNPGTQYVVTFDAATRAGYPQQTLSVYVGGTITNGALVGGTLVGTVAPGSTSWDSYTTQPFTVGQGSLPVLQLLTFTAPQGSTDQTAFLYNVTVNALPPSPLPLGTAWLTGTTITDSNDSVQAASAVSDGSASTSFDGAWTGIDLGPGKTATLTYVYYFPETDLGVPAGNPEGNCQGAMDGGVFEGSNDGTNWSPPLATVNNEASWGQTEGARETVWDELPVTDPVPYRYFRYQSPGGTCKVSEIRYFGNTAAIISSGASGNAGQAFDSNYLTTTTVNSQGYVGIDLGAGNSAVVNEISFNPGSNPSDMIGGVFEGCNVNSPNDSDWTRLSPTIATAPASGWNTIYMSTPNPDPNATVPYRPSFEFFRYYNPNPASSTVSEIQLYGAVTHLLTGVNFYANDGSYPDYLPTNVYDGDVNTVYYSHYPTGAFTGIDVGAPNAAGTPARDPAVVTSIRYYPNSQWGGGPAGMVGGVFQGSNDDPTNANAQWTNLTNQIAAPPTIGQWTTVNVIVSQPFRYLRYLDDNNNPNIQNYCNTAEVQFYGY